MQKSFESKLEQFKNSKLYLVSSQEFSIYPTEYIIEEALKGGLKLFQMREKGMEASQKLILAKKLKELSIKYNAIFLINDDVDLARKVGADGVHLGQNDMVPTEARKILGRDKIIGLSTHNYKEAMDAIKLPVNYINIGPVNPTNTKKHLQRVSKEEIEKIIRDINIPFTFMGGIKAEHIKNLYKYRPAALAMVTEITKADSVQKKLRELLSLF